MNMKESFPNFDCEDQIRLAERELSAFIGAVTELFGSEQARLSAQDWLDESNFIESQARATLQGWLAVTVAASARLARRIEGGQHRRPSRTASTGTDDAVPIASSKRFSSMFLF